MSELLSSITGGGGMFVPQALVSGRLVSGLSGTILDVAESGLVYRIKHLLCSGGTYENNMSLTVDGVLLFDNVRLEEYQPAVNVIASATGFGVAENYASATTSASRIQNHIFCTSFSLAKTTSTTGQQIDYVYEIGSFK